MSGHVVTQSDTTQLVLEMSDADIDAAVRFCDDVLSAQTLMLLPPTLENGKSGFTFFHLEAQNRHLPGRTDRDPGRTGAGCEIEIPSRGVWDASVLTAHPARASRKMVAKS